jgi:hypothetical protein
MMKNFEEKRWCLNDIISHSNGIARCSSGWVLPKTRSLWRSKLIRVLSEALIAVVFIGHSNCVRFVSLVRMQYCRVVLYLICFDKAVTLFLFKPNKDGLVARLRYLLECYCQYMQRNDQKARAVFTRELGVLIVMHDYLSNSRYSTLILLSFYWADLTCSAHKLLDFILIFFNKGWSKSWWTLSN